MEIASKVIKVTKKVLGYDKSVETYHRLERDLGVDDLDLVEIVMALEVNFNIYIDDSIFDNAKTVNDLVSAVRDSLSNRKEVAKDKSKKNGKEKNYKIYRVYI